MPSIDELRVIQKRNLTKLLMVQAGHIAFDTAITEAIAEMDAEDVSYVKEIVMKHGEK